jgi:hypothetical protein
LPSLTLSIGTRLRPYEVTAALGTGGMGEVYRATDTHLKGAVAIKVLLPASVAIDPERLARFQREAELLAALNHPNIGQIYGLEKSDGMTAIVMELVKGRRSRTGLRKGRMPLADRKAVLFTVDTGRSDAGEAYIGVLSLETHQYRTVIEQGYHAREVAGLRLRQAASVGTCPRGREHERGGDRAPGDRSRNDSGHAAVHVADADPTRRR